MSLPSGYKRLEYIQSSGTQYIDTGFKPNQNTRVVMDVTPVDVNLGKTWCAFGVRQNGIYFGLYKASTRNMNLTWFYGSNYSNYFTVDYEKRHNLEVNKNAASVDGISKSYAAQTFQFTIPLFLLCDNAAGSPTSAGAALLYSCKIYDNGTLIRDFIPCKNASGVVGMWDDVNSVFYQNAGSGTFTAGPEIIGSNRVLVDAKGYDANSGTVLVNGMVYHLKKGRGLLNGMGYDIPFDSGTPISDLAVGSTVKIAVNDTLRDFLIVHQGLPSSMYDDSCNGTWLLMKDIYENRQWHSSNLNNLENSTIHSYLNGTFLNLFDSNIKDAIKHVKIPYRKNGGSGGVDQSGANGLSAKIFLLSGYEVGLTTSDYKYFPVDGAKLSYFESGTGTSANNKRIAKLNGSASYWWLRSPVTLDTDAVWRVLPNGGYDGVSASYSYGIRPALVLPSDTLVSDDGTITT